MTVGQRFMVSLLCEDYAEVLRRRAGPRARRAGEIRAMAAVLRYVAAEGIHWREFTAADRSEFAAAYHAAVMADDPVSLTPGSLGYDMLVAEGLVAHRQRAGSSHG